MIYRFVHFESLGFSISTNFQNKLLFRLLLQCFRRLGIQPIYALKCGEKLKMETRKLLLKCTECIMTENNDEKSERRKKGGFV